jgi:transglutaminase-like putative cysteine protease
MAMKLSVRHLTTYHYASPMRMLVQSLRLTPSKFDGQKVLRWHVTVKNGREGAEFIDGAGDAVRTVAIRGPVEDVQILVEGQVQTTDLSGVLKNHREVVPPGAHLRATRATRPDVAVVELSRKVTTEAEGASPLDLAHALSGAVSEAIEYVPGESDSRTTAAEALAAGKGVCQDHAHALIALAHLAGMPARYVVGYMLSEATEEASHAWAELWIDRLGWVGFDPANRCCPDDRYIRLCSGYDAQDAAPIRGIAAGLEGETLEVDVAVQQSNQ